MVRDNPCDVKGLLDPKEAVTPRLRITALDWLCPRCVLLLRTKNVSRLNKYRCTYLHQKTKLQSLPPWKPEWDWHTALLLTSVVPRLLLDVQDQAPPRPAAPGSPLHPVPWLKAEGSWGQERPPSLWPLTFRRYSKRSHTPTSYQSHLEQTFHVIEKQQINQKIKFGHSLLLFPQVWK